ncbi:MAG: MBL fold metallo-hydrolase [Candidatus Roizmanbacteria bacterium]|nr:MAG: MBL fold metallo-hydrolase [Candidatus Roizmanbacteria bacterium]
MEIKYLGHSAFLIKTKDAKLVTDPFSSQMVGMSFPKIEADVVTISHSHADHNFVQGVSGDPLVIDWPGEFEKNGIRVFGYKWYHDNKKGLERGENILYKIEAENLTLLHCGDLGDLLNDELYEEIGNIDILFVPIGGTYTIDATTAASLVKKLDPSIIIPMHYSQEKLSEELRSKLSPVSDFLKEMGIDEVNPVDKLVVKKEDLSEEQKVIVMAS